jgi:glycosyltransferase involved in cell wall biosynthesis
MTASVAEYASMQREVFDLVERFVVLNETARRMLIANGSPAEKIAINRLGVSHPPRARGLQERQSGRPIRFGYIGRLHPSKGLMDLVQAAHSVPDSVRFTLSIRGPVLSESTQRFVDTLRASAQHDERIQVNPGVSPSDIPAVLWQLDVLLCPSMSFENGPTVALEAAAAGVPVVAAAHGGLPEVIRDGETGLLVPPRDPNALAGALRRLADDPSLGERLAAAASADVRERFSRERMLREVQDLYERLLSRA